MLFRLHAGVPAEVRTEAIARLQAAEITERMSVAKVAMSLDGRKGVVLVLDATFASEHDFRAYQVCSAHRDLGHFMSKISDWWVGDYETSVKIDEGEENAA